MTTPETTIAIADGAQGARPGKPGKKPNAGATAGAFTAELASLTAKNKKAKIGHTTEFPRHTTDAGHDPVDKKPSVEAGKPKRNSAVAQTTEAKSKTHKEQNEAASETDALIAAAAASGDRTKLGEAFALAAGTTAKGGDGQTNTRPHPEPKIPAASTIPEPGRGAKPEAQPLVDAPNTDQKAAALKSLAKDQKHHAKFDEMIAQHQSNSQPQSSQPSAAQVQAAAQQQQAHSHAQTLRAEATQAAAASDSSSAQANALLRTPEASSSSAGFEAHLDAPTATRAVEQVAWTIARKSETGERNFEIRMDPPELGRIDVKMHVSHDGKLSAVLSVDRPETLDLLTRDSRALELALKDTGLDVGSGALNFSLRDQHAQGFRDDSFQGRNREDEGSPEAQNANSTAEQIWLGAPKSLLDIRI